MAFFEHSAGIGLSSVSSIGSSVALAAFNSQSM
jgi:hypothetical protein